jgi:hypothetical protein
MPDEANIELIACAECVLEHFFNLLFACSCFVFLVSGCTVSTY